MLRSLRTLSRVQQLRHMQTVSGGAAAAAAARRIENVVVVGGGLMGGGIAQVPPH